MTDDYVKAGEILIVKGENEDPILNPLRDAGYKLCLVEPTDDKKWRWIIMTQRRQS